MGGGVFLLAPRARTPTCVQAELGERLRAAWRPVPDVTSQPVESTETLTMNPPAGLRPFPSGGGAPAGRGATGGLAGHPSGSARGPETHPEARSRAFPSPGSGHTGQVGRVWGTADGHLL